MLNRKNLALFFTLLIFLLTMSPVAMADGTATLEISKTVYVGGKEIKPGLYGVLWKSGGAQAEVTFKLYGKLTITVPVKITENDKKFDNTVMTVAPDSSGKEALQTIRFGGKKTQLEF